MSSASWCLSCLCLGLGAHAVLLVGCGKSEPESPGKYILTLHEIEPGKAYRSGQLSPEGLAWVIDKHGIKTVLNLRGTHPDKKWYEDEEKTCDEKHVTLVSVPMSAQTMPAPDLLRSVVNTLRTSPKPVLIHCESGCDRTGAVAALYRLDVLKQDRATAARELSSDYGHLRSQKPCMDTLIERYESTPEWMAQYAREHGSIECK